MKLKKFAYSNLFSLGKGEIDLENKGVLLITGYSEDEGSSNGSGKSSLSSKGIVWTLYGQTPSGLKADQVINRHGKKKSAWGEVEYVGIDQRTYKIRRSRPTKLQFWVQGEDGEWQNISAKKSSDSQEQIDKSLGRDFQTFLQTEFFGQGRLLSYASLTPSGQKAVLEQILPIEKLEAWAERAKSLVKDVKAQHTEADRELTVVSARLNGEESHAQQILTQSKEWEQKQKDQITHWQSVIAGADAEYQKVKENIEFVDREIAQIKILSDGELQALEEEQDEYWSQEADAAKQIQEINKAIGDLKYRKGKITLVELLYTCPTCDQDLPAEKIKELQVQQEHNKALLQECDVNIYHCEEVLAKWNEHLSRIRQRRNEIATNLRQNDYNRQQLGLKEGHKRRLEDELRNSPVEEAQRKLEDLNTSENPYTSLYKEVLAKIEVLQNEMTKAEEKEKNLAEEIDHLTFWQQAFGTEMRLKLFQMACPFLENRTAYHLSRLGNSQIKTQFSTVKVLASGETREDFNVRVWSETGGEGFDSLSGGEQQMVSFAIGRALADLARSQVTGESYFQILDEPFSMLDDRNSELIVNYLNEEMRAGTILLISNEDQLKSLVPNRIHVVKKQGISNAQSAT